MSHVVFRIVRDPRDGEEVCQDVFVRVYQKLDQFAHESALGTWIARIAYRLSLNHLERRRIPLYDDLRPEATGGTAVDQLPGTRASPLDEAEGADLRAFVRARVDELPVQYRTLVTLYHLEEMAVAEIAAEIAAVMDLPEGTVKSHLFRARRMLKEKLVVAAASEHAADRKDFGRRRPCPAPPPRTILRGFARAASARRRQKFREPNNPVTTTPSQAFTYSGEELDALGEARNYYGWIVRRFAPYLGRRIVEVGAGIGTFAEHLRAAAPDARLTLVEPAANNWPHLSARFADRAHVTTRRGYLADAGEPGSADTVVAVNVMEHVRDDDAFLADAHRLLSPGGHALLFVPALPAIYGSLDEAFEHYRRYTKGELTQRLRGAGLAPVSVAYTNLPGVVAWWMSGRVLRRRTMTARDARLYDRWMIPWISRLERVWTPPLGQSLIAVARKGSG